MPMIQVLARKAIQFRNPNKALLEKGAKPGELGGGGDQAHITAKLEEAFCRVLPGVVTRVPDWVKTDPVFDWCVEDGTLMEIVVNPTLKGAAADLSAKGQQQVAAEQSEADKAAAEKAKADLHEKLEHMTKAELIDYAFQNHDMELSPAMKNEDLRAAIKEAIEEKEKEEKAVA